MSTEEPKTQDRPQGADAPAPPPDNGASSDTGGVDAAVAWPPPEAAPEPAAAKSEQPAESAAATDPPMTAPEQPAAPAPATKDPPAAALPDQEMGLSDSTLHWLEDESAPAHVPEPGTLPSYDPKAPVAGRRRTIVVVGGAGILAVAIAGYFYAEARQRQAAAPPPPVVVEPARDLTTRAEAALAANKVEEALDLAHLALVADPRFADAHFLVATVMMSRSNASEARDSYRKYLELAPWGKHAQAARENLAKLPP